MAHREPICCSRCSTSSRQHATTAITSNIKLSAWGKYLGDATLAAAVLDRLAANSIHIDIYGPSTASTSRTAGQAHGLELPVQNTP